MDEFSGIAAWLLAYLLSPEQARGRTRIPSGDWTDADRHKEDWR